MKINLNFKKYTNEDRVTWEKINIESDGVFLTSINWIDFQKKLNKDTDQYLIYLKTVKGDVLIGNLYIEIYIRKAVKFAYSPYGPVINWQFIAQNIKIEKEDLYKEVFEQLRLFQLKYIKQKGLTLFRFDPLIKKQYLSIFKKINYLSSKAPAQAKDVWEIDISIKEADLLKEMKKVARYNIKKSKETGIEIIKVNIGEENLIKEFSNILSITTSRHKFSSYDHSYFVSEFMVLNPLGMCDIFLAKYKDKYISGALINTYNKIGYYSHGGSLSDKYLQKYGASYLLHWEIIKYLKSLGVHKYNMWGILPESLEANNTKKFPLAGVSDFKKRFGGHEINYVGALETYSHPLNYLLHRVYDIYIYRNDRY